MTNERDADQPGTSTVVLPTAIADGYTFLLGLAPNETATSFTIERVTARLQERFGERWGSIYHQLRDRKLIVPGAMAGKTIRNGKTFTIHRRPYTIQSGHLPRQRSPKPVVLTKGMAEAYEFLLGFRPAEDAKAFPIPRIHGLLRKQFGRRGVLFVMPFKRRGLVSRGRDSLGRLEWSVTRKPYRIGDKKEAQLSVRRSRLRRPTRSSSNATLKVSPPKTRPSDDSLLGLVRRIEKLLPQLERFGQRIVFDEHGVKLIGYEAFGTISLCVDRIRDEHGFMVTQQKDGKLVLVPLKR